MLTFSANAATVKLGGDGGELNFVPATVTIAKGESVTWCAPSRTTERPARAATGVPALAPPVRLRPAISTLFPSRQPGLRSSGSHTRTAYAPNTPLECRVNNKGFPHNVVFDEDAVPAGVSADALSHEDYLNGAGDSVSTKFDVAGTYEYYCQPHQGAGMQGKVIVQ